MRLYRYFFLLFVLLLFSCVEQKQHAGAEKKGNEAVIANHAMVVSAREEASKIGIEILQKGGNAFDAMVATEMALAVTYPCAGNLGGGGFMVYRTQFEEVGTFDFREKAPLKADRDMYLDSLGNYNKSLSKTGGKAIGVPGTVAGIFAVHEKLGSLPIEEILQPVVDLAKNGFVITQQQADRFAKHRSTIQEVNGGDNLFTKLYKAGDTLKNKKLAQTLERLIVHGRSEFYQGETAKILIETIRTQGGLITHEDLNAYEVVLREPIVFSYKDLQFITMGPPSSGGICLAQILKMIEPYPLSDYGFQSLKSTQLLVEAERRSYADRSYYLGDPDFASMPIDSLISEPYLSHRMEFFSFERASPSNTITYGTILPAESFETTHYSIVDGFGNAVATTTTLNAAFGSKVYVEELGFFLNNEMDDFSAKPGEPNMFGLIGGEANAIAPQKRMLSSMTPTIIEKDGKLWMVLGSPGGATIITSVLQTVLNVYEFDMTLQEAVNAPRFHHQWLPDTIQMEPSYLLKDSLDSLQNKGYVLSKKQNTVLGRVDAILLKEDGKLEGAADPRGDDRAVGY